MELHPILEARCSPNPGLWYCISASGNHPSLRVGHSCTYIPGPDNMDGKVYIIGGANPDEAFRDVFILDLTTFSWDQLDIPCLKPRYEHSAFVPKSKPHLIYVYGGASKNENRNDVQCLDTATNSCQTVAITSGNPPSARTFRGSAVLDDRFMVYSGGRERSEVVGDRQVHCFDAHSHSWTKLNVKGDPPTPRQGHLMLSAGEKVIIHGGLSGSTLYDDLHILDTRREVWTKCKKKKGAPCPRASHSGCYHEGYVYIFGGMSKEGALDDLYQLNLDTLSWHVISIDGPPPPTRLSSAMCIVRVRVPDTPPTPGEEEGAGDTTQHLLAAGQRAKETVEEQLRLSSAGSVRSVGSSSAGSQRSDPVTASQILEATPVAAPLAPREAQEIQGPSKVVEMLLLHGGMDCMGEIFDDCLVYMLKQEKASQAADA